MKVTTGTVHGGELLKLVDSIAGVVSARHCEGCRCWPESPEDQRRCREAGIRRSHRLARRAAIESSRAI